MTTLEAREKALRDYCNKPGGYKEIATAAIAALPNSALKKLVEALEIENKVLELKKNH